MGKDLAVEDFGLIDGPRGTIRHGVLCTVPVNSFVMRIMNGAAGKEGAGIENIFRCRYNPHVVELLINRNALDKDTVKTEFMDEVNTRFAELSDDDRKKCQMSEDDLERRYKEEGTSVFAISSGSGTGVNSRGDDF